MVVNKKQISVKRWLSLFGGYFSFLGFINVMKWIWLIDFHLETISKWPQKGTSIDGVTKTQWASCPLESRKWLCLAGSFSRKSHPSWWFQHVSTPLKNMIQNGNLPQIGVKIKDIWKHHPAPEEFQRATCSTFKVLGFLLAPLGNAFGESCFFRGKKLNWETFFREKNLWL